MPTSSLSAREMRTRWALVAALLLLLHLPSPVRTQCAADFFGSGCQQVYSVTTVVGFLGLTGFADGAPSVTRVNTVSGLALDASGNAWFSDVSNGAIRVLNSSTGNVSTLLRGGSYVSAPTSLALDAAGNMYYADMGTSGTTPYIRRINIATGAASAIAGTGGTGTANGFATASSFRSPRGIAFDGSGTLVVIADTGNNAIRLLNLSSNTVSLLAGGGGTGAAAGWADGTGTAALFTAPFAVLYCNMTGNFLVLEGYSIRVVTPAGVVMTLAGTAASVPYDGTTAAFTRLYGGTLDAACNVYVLDSVNNNIPIVRIVTPAGVVTTVAGNPSRVLNFTGMTSPTPPTCRTCGDGYGSDGLFEQTGYAGMVGPDALGNLYFGSPFRIRRLSPSTLPPPSPPLPPYPPLPPPSPPPPPWNGSLTPSLYSATTIWPPYASATADGTGTSAGLFQPTAIAVNLSDGSMYVIDNGSRIRFVTAAGVVTTIAGSSTAGYADGQGTNVMFNRPSSLAVLGNLVYIADGGNCVIRAMTRDGVVTTVYGSGVSGYANGQGTLAQFTCGGVQIGGVAADPVAGVLYVADSGANLVRRIDGSGNITLYAGGGNGLSSGYADGPATLSQFSRPTGLAVGPSGTLYVADYSNQRLRAVSPNGTVWTLAGDVGGAACSQIPSTSNCFSNPSFVAVDVLENVYVSNSPPLTMSSSTTPTFVPQARYRAARCVPVAC